MIDIKEEEMSMILFENRNIQVGRAHVTEALQVDIIK